MTLTLSPPRDVCQTIASLTDLQAAILSAIEAAAVQAAPCPTNFSLAEQLDTETGSISHALERLVSLGLLAVGTDGAKRRIRACRIGLTTGWSHDRRRTRTREGAAIETKKRPCMMCTRPFPSEGDGHRVCDSCKQTSAWRSGGDYAPFECGRRL